jgi:hypothetical protein
MILHCMFHTRRNHHPKCNRRSFRFHPRPIPLHIIRRCCRLDSLFHYSSSCR